MKLFRLKPAQKDYLWGGERLKKEWNKASDFSPLAECWELSFHRDGPSTVAAGIGTGAAEAVGKTLPEAVPPEAFGKNCKKFPFFPVLVKFIDAADNLSVQVHPSDEYALAREGQFGKTEMWYICDREAGAGIYCGFNRAISPEEYAERIRTGTLTEALRFFPVEKGECYFIPAGTVHAIGGGTTICEIQQNSNLTYRVYDFGRVGKDGNPRELHVDRAKEVSLLCPYERGRGEEALSESVRRLASCPYFTVYEMRTAGETEIPVDESSFVGLTVIEGAGEMQAEGESLAFQKGDTFFATAEKGTIRVRGNATLLLVRVE